MHTRLGRFVHLAIPLAALPLWAAPAAAQRGGNDSPASTINVSTDPILNSFHFRSIGPASMGGRIDDIEVAQSDQNIIYLGYAVGGVFKSENNGTSFKPVFQTYTTASIGDIAIHPTNPNIVYVGTGEPNNRQTSSFGNGIYKTTDGGKTFTNIGLQETQSIGRIVIDPRNPDVVYVASPGHLFGPNPERGVFKTTDGGKSWNKVKYIDENTGFNDITMDPKNSNVLYASSYQRRRSGCCFNGGGPGSGLWKTTDAGKTWTKLTGNGLPPGTYGRIALAVSHNTPNVLFAQIEAGETGPEVVAAAQAGDPANGGRGGRNAPRYDACNNAGPNGGWSRGRGAPEPEPGAATPKPPALDPAQGGLFRSDNGGRSWTLLSNCNSRPMYFSQLRVDPSNDKTLYVAGLPVAKSLDGGKSFATLDESGGYGEPGHVDQHAIWIDPRNPRHIMIGNDGGLDISWDQGKSWDFVNTMATGLAYVVTADMRRPYHVYIGLQDNGSWGGPSSTRSREGILNSDWFGIGGGDGFYTAVDPTDHNIVYTESQDGNTNRYNLLTGESQRIRPSAGGSNGGRNAGTANVINAVEGERYRFNWNTPVLLSPHNPSILWLGGNRLFKSYDRGDSYVASADLTKNIDRNTVALMGVPGDQRQISKNDGVVSYSTIISISESPVMPGVVWAGTDDGNLQVSRDGGTNFTEVGKNLPGLPANNRYWISRIDASHFDAATAYVSVDGHRSDDLKPYVFVTHDYGNSWQSITNNLPAYGNVQVIREDPQNKNLLFVGTEFGLYASTNGGKAWQKFMNNFPTVRVDDILIHPRDGDLIVATHGRSVWIADDITPLQQLTPSEAAKDAVLFDIRPAVAYLSDRQAGQQVGGQKVFIGENAPRGTAISYYLKSAASGDVKITISDATGSVIRELDGDKAAGINRVQWNLTAMPPLPPNLTPAQRDSARAAGAGRGGFGGGFGRGGGTVDPGTYLVKLTVGGRTYTTTVDVLKDEWMGQ